MNNTSITEDAVNVTKTLSNETFGNTTHTNGSYFDNFMDTVYYEINTMRDSQMIMGTMFLGMVLGMIIMVLCCVKHKADGYYRVPPHKHAEELELVPTSDPHRGHLPGEDERIDIGLGDND